MKKTITNYDFRNAFDQLRPDSFSYAGLNALFNYFEELEEDRGIEIELDVIAICCDFTEYTDIHEFVANYGDSYIIWETEPDEDEDNPDGEVDYEATISNISEHTTVIDIDGTSFIIQDF